MKYTRIGNEFITKKSKCGHYYIALLLNNNRVSSWVRITKADLNKHYKPIGV